MVSWQERRQADDKIVALAVDQLLTFLRKYPEATVEQVTEVMQTLSANYGPLTAATAYQALQTSREAWELWDLLPRPEPAFAAPADQVEASTAWALQTRSGKQLAAAAVEARLVGVLTRMVRQPGRETVVEATRTAGTQWARVPGYHACDFCLMLASRGAVYESKQTALLTSGERGTCPAGMRYHDRCSCIVVESYTDADLPAVVKSLNKEWYDVTWDENGPVADQIGVWKEHVAITRPDHTTLRPPSGGEQISGPGKLPGVSRKRAKATMKTYLSGANPGARTASTHEEFTAYSTNCIRTTHTALLRRMGYDVTAGPGAPKNYDLADTVRMWRRGNKRVTLERIGGETTLAEALEQINTQVPDGAAGAFRFARDRGTAHALIWEKVDGRVVLSDPQLDKEQYDVTEQHLMARPGSFGWARLDDAQPTEKLARIARGEER